ncbi:hypothetical protein Misp01_29110 [Microtetraspora sp. NBRC 13810]|nr:hypothetical protein Misp01_29110 [Microtetraspora sp. NBRC 13810]
MSDGGVRRGPADADRGRIRVLGRDPPAHLPRHPDGATVTAIQDATNGHRFALVTLLTWATGAAAKLFRWE